MHRPQGFTLVEILVVLVISVGLVALMATLYRSVGQAAKALRTDNSGLMLQLVMREQLLNGFGFAIPGSTPASSQVAVPWISGSAHELYFLTWRSRSRGTLGKPVLAHYRCDPDERILAYRERELPAWWGSQKFPDVRQQIGDLQNIPFEKVVTGLGDCRFDYFDSVPLKSASVEGSASWGRDLPPKLVTCGLIRPRNSPLVQPAPP